MASDGKLVDTGLEYQVDISSAPIINGPEYIMVTHETETGVGVPNKGNRIEIFGNLDVRKCFCDFDGTRYLKDSANINYDANVYRDQYRDPNLFYKVFVGEELLNPFISYPGKKTFLLSILST